MTSKHKPTVWVSRRYGKVPDEIFQKGLVQQTLGFPLQSSLFDDVFGGKFLYYQEPNLVLAGLVVGLDYKNPYLNPTRNFKSGKHITSVNNWREGLVSHTVHVY
jgi:electron-transferring-flavoprotein dehydrogenase